MSKNASLEAKKKKLEAQLVQMEIKIRELESGSLKGGKKYVMKLGKLRICIWFSQVFLVSQGKPETDFSSNKQIPFFSKPFRNEHRLRPKFGSLFEP